jgi:modulator of FtsH protease
MLGETMNDYPYNFGRGGTVSTAEVRNRVLRATRTGCSRCR